MTDWGRSESFVPILFIGILAMLGVYYPRLWGLGLIAGVLLLALYEFR